MIDLTDKWKKGELPCGWYYIKIADLVFIDFFEGKAWKNKKDEYIDEVLEPVPSYEEYLSLTYAKEEDEKIIAEYEAENTKLKALLKEVRGKLKYINTPRNNHNIFGNDLMKKINQALGEDK